MTLFSKITVLGGGAFGVALAKLSASKAKQVVLWARDQEVVKEINLMHRHPHKLNDILLPNNILASEDLAASSSHADVLILALPLESMASVLLKAKPYLRAKTTIISTSKGISSDSLALPCDIIKHCLAENLAYKACYLSGPSFASELAAGLPTALTIASFDQFSAQEFQQAFSGKNCRLYSSNDVISVCLGGALKNVVAIAAGICTGLGLGHNALAALITRGLAEISRLAKKMGGRADTLSGLAGVGDLVLSCTDDKSRNHLLGTMIAQGFDLESALDRIASVVEGAKTARVSVRLSAKWEVEMPICVAVYRVLYEGISPKVALSTLLEREPKEEQN